MQLLKDNDDYQLITGEGFSIHFNNWKDCELAHNNNLFMLTLFNNGAQVAGITGPIAAMLYSELN